jgi:ABC-type oligopeptide transport system substrate-binding subunit
MPLNRQFFLEQGGAFGLNEFKEAKADPDYNFGIYGKPETQLYNSAFIPQQLSAEAMTYVKNPNYYDANSVTLDSIQWVKDNGEDGEAIWNKAKDGTYAGTGLSEGLGTLKKAKDEGIFEDYHYITDTNTTTFFNGFNLNRGTFEVGTVVSSQSEAQKIATHNAMQNTNFRRALQHAWNRVNHNAVSVGEELAPLCVRNMYTQPTFLSLSKDVEYDNQVFEQGTFYGEIVEWFLKNEYNRPVETEDGQDGWYNAQLAAHYLELAKEEMGEDWEKVVIDLVYYEPNKTQTGQANYFKLCVEEALGAENVEINIIGTSNVDDFYLCGYDSPSGLDACYDVFYGSGWGPDYGDPSTYLDTFNYGGYMLKVIGLDC